jgi:type I restriction enzyme S subunit
MTGLPKGWTTAPLLDVVELHDSRRIPLNATERASRKGEYPYYGANGQVDTIDDYLFDGDYTLLAEDGGYFDQPWRGVAVKSGSCWINGSGMG